MTQKNCALVDYRTQGWVIFRNSVPRLDFRMDLLLYTLIDYKNTFFELLGFMTAKGQRSDFYVISRILAKFSTF